MLQVTQQGECTAGTQIQAAGSRTITNTEPWGPQTENGSLWDATMTLPQDSSIREECVLQTRKAHVDWIPGCSE